MSNRNFDQENVLKGAKARDVRVNCGGTYVGGVIISCHVVRAVISDVAADALQIVIVDVEHCGVFPFKLLSRQ